MCLLDDFGGYGTGLGRPRLPAGPTSSVVSFVVAMNRVDVVDLVVDLVDLDHDVDLVDVDLAVSLCDGPRSVLFSFGLVAPTCFIYFWPRLVLVYRYQLGV